MKKRMLCIVLAFVMVCSACLFSASAETVNTQPIETEALKQEIQQNIAAALAESGGELYTPLATGDRAFYGLARIPNGQMLLHQGSSVTTGSTPYMGYFSASNTLHTWVFEEYITGSYIVRPVNQSSLCLTVNATTGAVSLQPFASQIEQYWSPITYGDGVRLMTNSSASAVSMKYLDASSVSTSGTVYGMIPQINLSDLTAIYQYGTVIQKGSSKTLSAPIYSNAATYDFSPWVGYTSNNSNICSVSQSGVVTGHQVGTAEVMVSNAIMQASYTCPITIVDGNTTMDVNVVYELSSYTVNDSTSEYLNYLESSLSLFENEFYISASTSSMGSTPNLDGNDCADVHSSNMTMCSADPCGANERCSDIHHRSSLRLLWADVGNVPSGTYLVRYVNHAMCYYDSEDERHYGVNGLTYSYGDDAIVTKTSSDVIRTTRHEISHWFGALDDDCNHLYRCMMSSSTENGNWCVNCYNRIVQARASKP
ncbi:MAG: hypothetical protein IJW40_03755 [Clostridia bacterium]|nr:hypothetical protein [Clostridia bacterium]